MPDTVTITPTTQTITVTPAGGTTTTITPAVTQTVTITQSASTSTNISAYNTDNLAEGSTNLYHTNARASAAAPVQSLAMPSGYTVTDTSGALAVSVTNATNVRSGIGFDAAARAAVSATGTGISYNSSTGVITSLMTSTATSTKGISDTNVLECNANVADDDFLRIDGTKVEGRTASEVLSDIGAAAAAHTHADAYTGQIEAASNKTYTIEPGAVSARTITGFYIKSASGTCTATLKVGTNTVKAASVSSSSGDQTSLANTAVAVNDVITIVVSSNSTAIDVIFSVEYTA